MLWPPATAVAGHGKIRERLDDFGVFERLAFAPTGEGERVFLEIEKRGRESLPMTGAIRDLEIAAIANEDCVRDALEWVGLKQDRRALTARSSNVSCRLNGARLSLRFFLPKGAHATTVLREALDLEVVASGR